MDNIINYNNKNYIIDNSINLEFNQTPNSTSLSFSNVSKFHHSGFYLVKLKDSNGECCCFVELVVKDKPYPPKNIKIKICDQENENFSDNNNNNNNKKIIIKLTWEIPEFEGENEIINYIIERYDYDDKKWIFSSSVPSNQLFESLPASLILKSSAFRIASQTISGIGGFSQPCKNKLFGSRDSKSSACFIENFPSKLKSNDKNKNFKPSFIKNFSINSRSKRGNSLEVNIGGGWKDQGWKDQEWKNQEWKDGDGKFKFKKIFLDDQFKDFLPCAPGNLIIIPLSDSKINIKWKKPKNITNEINKNLMKCYVVEVRKKFSNDWEKKLEIPLKEENCFLENLEPEVDFFIRVFVKMVDGRVGPSRESIESFNVKKEFIFYKKNLPLTPGKPKVTEIEGDLNKCLIEWKFEEITKSKLDKPEKDKINNLENETEIKKTELKQEKLPEINHFIVETVESDGFNIIKNTKQTTKNTKLIIDNLENNVEYRFFIYSCNNFGLSNASLPSNPFVIPTLMEKEEAVKVEKKLKDEEGVEGSEIIFQSKFKGFPRPEIKWLKDFSEIKNNSKYEIITNKYLSTSILKIKNINEGDDGEVESHGSNPFSSSFTRATLTVKTPAKIRLKEKINKRIKINKGELLKLRIPLAGYPQPEVDWEKDGEKLNEKNKNLKFFQDDFSATLQVENFSRGNDGRYKANIFNYLGSDEIEFIVFINDRPKTPISQPMIKDIKNNKCTLLWSQEEEEEEEEKEEELSILEYFIEMKIYENEEKMEEEEEEEEKNNGKNWKIISRINPKESINKQTANQKEVKFIQTTIQNLPTNQNLRFRIKTTNLYGKSNPGPPSKPIKIKQISCSTNQESYDKYVVENNENDRKKIDITRLKCETALNKKYKICEQISRGRFGVIHRAEDRVKKNNWLARFTMTTRKDKMLMKASIELLNNLYHKNIIFLHDAYEAEGELALFFEFISGPDLLTKLTESSSSSSSSSGNHGNHTELKIINYLKQICSAINYLHNNDIIHLDIRPEMIFFTSTKSEILKITNFDTCNEIVNGRIVTLHHNSISHLSPQLLTFNPVSFPADLWSIGVMAYVLISGELLFEENNEKELIKQIINCENINKNNNNNNNTNKNKNISSHIPNPTPPFDPTLSTPPPDPTLSRPPPNSTLSTTSVALSNDSWVPFSSPIWSEISSYCKDFICKCLDFNPLKRINIHQSLSHPWLNGEAESKIEDKMLDTENLKQLIKNLKLYSSSDILPIGRLSYNGSMFKRMQDEGEDGEEGREITLELSDHQPLVLNSLSNCESFEGSVARFKCKFKARPEATINWFYENKPIEEISSSHVTSNSKKAGLVLGKFSFWYKNGVAMLSINDVEVGDAGIYSCSASNFHGEASTSAVLIVQTFSWKKGKNVTGESVLTNENSETGGRKRRGVASPEE